MREPYFPTDAHAFLAGTDLRQCGGVVWWALIPHAFATTGLNRSDQTGVMCGCGTLFH